MAVNKKAQDKIISSGNSRNIKVTGLNNTHSVIAWEDASASKTTIKTTFYNKVTNSIGAVTTIISPITDYSMYDHNLISDGKGGYALCWTQDGSVSLRVWLVYKNYYDKDAYCNVYNAANQLVSTQRALLNNDQDYQYDLSSFIESVSKVAIVWSSKDIINPSDANVNINYVTYNPKSTSSTLSSSSIIASGAVSKPYMSSSSNSTSIVSYIDSSGNIPIIKGRMFQNNVASSNVFSISSNQEASE